MKSIRDLGIEFFIPKKNLKNYEKVANQKKDTSEIIYELLTFIPGFMLQVPNNQQAFLLTREQYTKSIIDSFVKEGKKLEFVTFYFNAKSSKKSITNNLVFPDASDFLTLLHLNLVFFHINKVYPPGANLYLGSEINYFYQFATQNLKTTSEMTSILLMFKSIIENMIGSKTHIYLFDILEEISYFKKDFFSSIEKEKFIFLNTENAMAELEKTADYYFNFVIDVTAFPSKEAARNFCIFHSLDALSYNTTIRTVTELDRGFFENFNEKILINPRFFENSSSHQYMKEIFLPLLPGSFTFSFNMLSLKTKENKWKQITYQEIKEQNYQAYFVQDLAYPFFFTENRTKGELL